MVVSPDKEYDGETPCCSAASNIELTASMKTGNSLVKESCAECGQLVEVRDGETGEPI